MSVVIVGGNECMARRYADLCREYRCKAKVFPLMKGELRDFGKPDLLVLFTGTVSHKMVRCALDKTDARLTKIVRSHSSSITALKQIMDTHCGSC